MTPELLNLIINAGGSAVLTWLVWEMRREAREDREKMWALLNYLVRLDNATDSQIRRLDDLTTPPR